jgi:hypothetical protein
MEQRAQGTLRIWAEPFVSLRAYRHRRSPDHAGHPFTEKGNQARCLWISWRWKLRLQPALRRGVASLNGRHIYGEATTHPDGFRHQTLGIGFTDRAKSRSDSTGWPGLLEAKLPIA